MCIDRNSNSYFQKKIIIPISKKNYVLTQTKYSKKKKKKNYVLTKKNIQKKKSTIIRIIRKTHKKNCKKEQKPTKRERVLTVILWENMDYMGEMAPNLYKIK